MKESDATGKFCPLIKPNAEVNDGQYCYGSKCMMWEEWAGHWEENPKYKDDRINERPQVFIKGSDYGDCGLKSKDLEVNI